MPSEKFLSYSGNLKGGHHLEDTGVDARIM
jgi:hypothetical protein